MKRIILVSAALLAVSACESMGEQQSQMPVDSEVGDTASDGMIEPGDIPGEDIFYGSNDKHKGRW